VWLIVGAVSQNDGDLLGQLHEGAVPLEGQPVEGRAAPDGHLAAGLLRAAPLPRPHRATRHETNGAQHHSRLRGVHAAHPAPVPARFLRRPDRHALVGTGERSLNSLVTTRQRMEITTTTSTVMHNYFFPYNRT